MFSYHIHRETDAMMVAKGARNHPSEIVRLRRLPIPDFRWDTRTKHTSAIYRDDLYSSKSLTVPPLGDVRIADRCCTIFVGIVRPSLFDNGV